MKKLAHFCVRRRWYVLAFWVALFVGMSGLATSWGAAYSDNFSLPGTDSVKAMELLKVNAGASGDQDQVVFHVPRGTFTTAQRNAITTALQTTSQLPNVARIASPFCGTILSHGHALAAPVCRDTTISRDGTIAYATISFDTAGYKIPIPHLLAVQDALTPLRSSQLQVEFGGSAFNQLDQPKGNAGELFGLLAAVIILLLAFGSVMAMLLPIGVALFALGIASAATILLSHGIGIASFAPILGSLIGLGVGIDYALFIVTRARQELQRGVDVPTAVLRAVNTSGRAVIFAGLTVCTALLGMLTLRLSYLNGVAISASLTVLITMLASITLLPALLAFWKTMVLNRKDRKALKEHAQVPNALSQGWIRWSNFVAKYPRRLSLAAILVMVVVASPVLQLHLGSSDQGQNPPTSTTRQAYDLLATGFGPGFNGPLIVVGDLHTPRAIKQFAALSQTLAHHPGVAATSPVIPVDGAVYEFTVVPTTSPQDTATSALISTIRTQYDTKFTGSSHVYVGGITAIFDDFAKTLSDKLPLFLAVIVFLGCLLLLVAFRSVLVPLVAAAMNLLATGASFGLVVAVFQWGWGSHLLNSGTGPIESFLPVIMIAILFGLSMDYQVFLVSRMHEEWLHTGDNEAAITRGQASTGRVITAAALIMIAVFSSFAFGGQRVIAEFGIGLGGAVLMDAFVIRTVLVPALMHFLGRANWWMPASLEKVIPHVAVEASEEDAFA